MLGLCLRDNYVYLLVQVRDLFTTSSFSSLVLTPDVLVEILIECDSPTRIHRTEQFDPGVVLVALFSNTRWVR